MLKELLKSKVHWLTYSILFFGVVGITSGIFGILLTLIGFKQIAEIFALVFAGCILIAILSMWLLNKYQD